MNKKPQVQIDEDLFLDLLRFFGDDCSDVHLQESINAALSDKVDKLIARKLFSEYKQAPTPERARRHGSGILIMPRSAPLSAHLVKLPSNSSKHTRVTRVSK